jgi:CheY-like chemotaxis protein
MAGGPESSTLPAESLEPHSILVVDDEEGVTEALSRLLQRHGYEEGITQRAIKEWAMKEVICHWWQ